MTATLSAGVTTGLERPFSEVLGDILGAGDVPVDAHFFDDLGADSMLMARFCARVRKRADLPSVSMKDVYAHPTVRGLAGALGPQASPLEQPFAQVLAEVLGVERGVGRRPLLRRPGRRLDGHGAVLRPGPQAAGPADGVDEGRLPPPDDQQPGRRSRSAPRRDGRRSMCRPRHRSSRRLDRWARRATSCAGRCSSCSSSAYAYLGALVDGVGRTSGCRRHRICSRSTAGGGGRRRRLPGCVPAADRREVGADRPVEAAGRSRSGAWRTSASGSSRRWSGRTRCFSWPVAGRTPAGVRRSTCCTCARWARRSAGTSRSSPGPCRSAPTCSPSATAR